MLIIKELIANKNGGDEIPSAFGLCCKAPVCDKWVPLVAVAAPLLCLLLDMNSVQWFNGYHFSYELLMMNAVFTIIGLCCLIKTR